MVVERKSRQSIDDSTTANKPDEQIGSNQPSAFSNQHQINRELVAEGWCWWYRKYAPEDVILVALEAAARVARKGLWVNSSLMPPWEWQKGAN